LLKYAHTREVVVRLKGGDPFIFGRGGEEALFLVEHGIEFEVVPGVSSFYSVPAYAGIPITFRGISSSFAVITGHEDPKKEKSSIDWESLKGINTLIVLMGVSRRKEIARRLIEIGRDPKEPVAFIENGTTERQRVILTDLYELSTNPPEVSPPAIMVVGSVVRLRENLSWYEATLHNTP